MGTDHLRPPVEPITLRERDHILNTAKTLISTDRNKNYGDATVNFARIAGLWKVIFGVEVTADQVATAMIAVKLSRLIETPDHADSWVDICGYAALGGEITSKPYKLGAGILPAT